MRVYSYWSALSILRLTECFLTHSLPACPRYSSPDRPTDRRDHNRLVKLFSSLSAHVHNAVHLRILELRVFPFGLRAEALEQLEMHIVRALQHAGAHLHELSWTRTGSLSDRVILELFPHLRALRRLELTGDSRTWDPALLVRSLKRPARRLRCRAEEELPKGSGVWQVVQEDAEESNGNDAIDPDEAEGKSVERLSLLMPDRRTASAIPAICERLGGQLKGLSVLSNHAPHLTDSILADCAPYLPHLSHLSIIGCRSISFAGLLPLLSVSRGKLSELALESLPSLQAADFQRMQPYLQKSLQVLSLTYPRPALDAHEYLNALADLLSECQGLHSFTLYAPGGSKGVSASGLAADGVGGGGYEAPESDEEEEEDAAPSAGTSDDGYRAAEEEMARQRRQREAHFGVPGLGPDGKPRYRYGIPMSGPALSTDFLEALLRARGRHLRLLRLHGIGMSLAQLEMICSMCSAPAPAQQADGVTGAGGELVDLVVHLYEADPNTNRLRRSLSKLGKLRSLHILSSVNSDMILDEEDLAQLVDACPTTLRQIGFRHRVWLVSRLSISFVEDVMESVMRETHIAPPRLPAI